MTVDTSGVTGTPHENDSDVTRHVRKFSKGLLAVSIVGSIIAIVITALVAGIIIGGSGRPIAQSPTLPAAGAAGGDTAPAADLGQPRLLEPQSRDETNSLEGSDVCENIVRRLTDTLSHAYQSRDKNWLYYYYQTPGDIIDGKSGQWHLGAKASWPGVSGYTGPGKVTYSNVRAWEYMGDYVVVEYDLGIDDTQYHTRQKIAWSYVNTSGDKFAWLVVEETAN